MTPPLPYLRPRLPRALRLPLLGLGLCLLLVLGGQGIAGMLEGLLDLRAMAADAMDRPLVLASLLALYVVLLACPFVPGAELGFLLLATLGGKVAAVVYLATLAGLCLAFGTGRTVPATALAAGFERVGARQAAALVSGGTASGPVGEALLRHRWLTLALLVNMPGNTLLGGGGGIALVAGMSRLVSPGAFLLTMALAVAPVPLAFGLAAWIGG